MDVELLFTLANVAVLPCWLALALAPRHRLTELVVSSKAASGALSLVYIVLLVLSLTGSAEGGLGSLASVRALFASDTALLAGWVHYLAFDLAIGAWEVDDARQRGVPHGAVVPCLILTLMCGPAGFVLYLGLRRLFARELSPEARRAERRPSG